MEAYKKGDDACLDTRREVLEISKESSIYVKHPSRSFDSSRSSDWTRADLREYNNQPAEPYTNPLEGSTYFACNYSSHYYPVEDTQNGAFHSMSRLETTPAMVYSPAVVQSIAQGSPRCHGLVYYEQPPHSQQQVAGCASRSRMSALPQRVDTTTPPWSYPYPLLAPPHGYPYLCVSPVYYGVVPPLPHDNRASHRRSASAKFPSNSTPRDIVRFGSMPNPRSKHELHQFHGKSNDKTMQGISRTMCNFVPCSAMIPSKPLSSSSPCYTDDSANHATESFEDYLDTRSKKESSTDPVLCNFKANKGENFTFEDIKGHMFNFCLDQTGSRFLQEQLVLVSQGEIDAVHDELGSHVSTLMKDVFGNYIVQILLQNGSSLYREKIINQIKHNSLELTLHVYGCRVMQKALEVLEYKEKCEMMKSLERNIARCVKDMNGNHVIQRAIRELDIDDIPSILNAVHERSLSFAVHPYGCRVVQRILECEYQFSDQCMTIESIMNKVVDNVEDLSQDLYGNYVVQHVLRYGKECIRSRAIDALIASPIDFACHKFASNVMEAAVTYSSPEERMKIVNSIVYAAHHEDRFDPLSLLTTNRFGNYVVQKLLDVVEEESKSVLLSSLSTRLKLLKRFKFGKHIVNLVEKMLVQQPSSFDGHNIEDEETIASSS
eukprot:g382.t1